MVQWYRFLSRWDGKNIFTVIVQIFILLFVHLQGGAKRYASLIAHRLKKLCLNRVTGRLGLVG